MNKRPVGSLAFAAGMALGVCAARAETPPRDAWTQAAMQRVTPAKERFEAAATAHQPDARLGLALTLLNVQPQSAGNIDRAAELLEGLRTSQPHSPIGIEAAYFLARVEQLHRFTPNPERALQLYDALAAEHPEHPLGQLAVVKAGMLRLMNAADKAAALAVVESLEAKAGGMSDSNALRGLHLLLADVCTLRQLSDEKTLEHLIAAEKLGLTKQKTTGDVLVRITELARKLNRPAVGREYAERFVRAFPQDPRKLLLQQRWQLPAEEPR